MKGKQKKKEKGSCKPKPVGREIRRSPNLLKWNLRDDFHSGREWDLQGPAGCLSRRSTRLAEPWSRMRMEGFGHPGLSGHVVVGKLYSTPEHGP
jgi:hypothetical protein